MENVEQSMIDAGMKPSVVTATMSIVRGLERDGINWTTVDGPELTRRCAGRPARLHRLRCALGHAFTFAEAQRRWPAVFRRTNARGTPEDPKTATIEGVLPAELLRCPSDNPMRALFELLFRRLCKRRGMVLASTFRVNLSSLYGFLCATPASLWPDAHSVTKEELEARVRVLAQDNDAHAKLVRAYDHYRQNSDRVERHVSLQTLCAQLHFLTVVFRDVLKVIKRPLECGDFGIMRPNRKRRQGRPRPGDAASQASTASVGNSTATSALSVFHEEAPIVDHSKSGWLREPTKSAVHCFNVAEVRALYLACQTDLEKVLVTALFTTGMRIGGFCLVLRAGAVHGQPMVAGHEITTNEKYNRVKKYPVARGLAALLPTWVSTGQCGDVYLFPGKPGGDQPLNTRRARSIFMNVAARAGITGRHVKPHTTRHTVCWTLSALGNKLEQVADFAGHRSTAVTDQVYIAMEEAQKRSRMDIPWLDTDGRTGAERLQEIALELASAIAGPFASEDGRTFPDYHRSGHRPRRSVTVVEPVIDENRHRAVAAASVDRAEQKAAKKAQRRQLKEQMLNQMQQNAALLQRLTGTVV